MPTAKDVTLLYLVKQVELAVRHRLDAVVAEHGLTSLQYTALTVLARHPGMSAADLARNSFVRAQTMTQMVLDLEGKGHLSREVDPSSRRRMLLTLTDRGRRVLEDLREPVAALEAGMVEGMSAADRAAFRAALESARRALGQAPPR
ncbi:MarR family winged helix-turn-helix transcriptional regulator [Kineococcus rhizosphaerae]|uniref:MarR family winged helix-turn-helix transcriptional regulator n=1 Tax=Kineococcus rhizosphaerae TaxID=559628 RepID=UPI000D048C3D|nr:MarR family transcriptional regulator [Kineococcus rhizosphaerae]